MSDAAVPRQIFRPDVVRRFTERQEQAILPRFVRPRIFLCLWILLALLASAAVAGWQVRVPERVSGPAVIVSSPGGAPEIVGFIPASDAPRLGTGQAITLRLPGYAGTISGTVEAVDLDIVSPAEAATLPGIGDPATLGLPSLGPMVIVRTPLDAQSGELDPAAFAGTGGRIEVTVGSQRLTRTMLPVGHVSIDPREHAS